MREHAPADRVDIASDGSDQCGRPDVIY